MFGWLGKKLLPSQQVRGLVQHVLSVACEYEVYTKLIEGGMAHGIRRKVDAPIIDIDGDGVPDK